MGYKSEINLMTQLESARNFSWLQAFRDTVNGRRASAAVCNWYSQQFDPTRNIVELLQIVNDDSHPVRVWGVDVDFDTAAANRQSGDKSLWIRPVGPPSLSEIRFKTPIFRVVDGETCTVAMRYKGDAGTSITFGFWGIRADGTEVAMGSEIVSPSLTWTRALRTSVFTLTPANPFVGAYIEALTNNGNVARNIWIDELTATPSPVGAMSGEYTGSTTLLVSLTPTRVVNPTINWNTGGGNYNTGTGTFTATIPGIYQFGVGGYFVLGLANRECWIGIFKNNAVYRYGNDFGSGNPIWGVNFTLLMPLVVGDAIDFRIYNGDAANRTISGSYFQWLRVT